MVRLSIVCLFLSMPAVAQTPPSCMSAGALDASLVDWYGEHVLAQSEDGQWVLWFSQETESWTLVRYLEGDMGCVAAHGVSLPDVADPLPVLARAVR